MPNRLIKESIRTSKSVNSLSDFEFRLWVYLITYVDDYGRGSADPEIIKGMVFTRRKGITEKAINDALCKMATSGMITLYEVDGESFFCFPNWEKHQQVRAKRSKFPAPDTSCKHMISDDIMCKQLISDDIICTRNPIQSESNPNPNTKGASAPPAHTRGEYGWVKLTDQQYASLLADLGQKELDRCIAYVDESAQSSGNKNKWKDWNLVIRRCHRDRWGAAGRSGAPKSAMPNYDICESETL